MDMSDSHEILEMLLSVDILLALSADFPFSILPALLIKIHISSEGDMLMHWGSLFCSQSHYLRALETVL